VKYTAIFSLVLVVAFLVTAFAALPVHALPSAANTVRGTARATLTSGVPVTGSLSGTGATVTYTMTVNSGCTKMHSTLTCPSGADFDLYGRLGAAPTTSTYTWRGYASGPEDVTYNNPGAGTWYIMPRSYSGSGAYTLTVTLTYGSSDTTPPTISITAPANGATVSGTVSVTFTASDNVGVTATYLSFDSAAYVTATSPYSWNTAGLSGSHTIQGKATDAAGNAGVSSVVTVTVNNGGGNVLTSGVPVSGSLSGSGATATYTIQVASGCTTMHSTLTCPSGSDFDLYGKLGSAPTTSTYDWRGYASGPEDVTFSNPGAGTWYIMPQSYSGSGAYTLTVTLTYGSSGPTWGNGHYYAVVVGIDHYKAINGLNYCHCDATDWYNYLTGRGYEVKVLTDGTTANFPRNDGYATEANYKLFLNSMLSHAVSGDHVAFVTSGHGSGSGTDASSYICTWDCSSGESGQDGCLYGSELKTIFNGLAAGVHAFIFVDHCYSGGLGSYVMGTTNKAYIYMTTTCTNNGYGYDDSSHQNGAWTYQFLEYGLITHFGSSGSTTMEACFSYALPAYPHTGGDLPQQFDGDTSTSYTLV